MTGYYVDEEYEGASGDGYYPDHEPVVDPGRRSRRSRRSRPSRRPQHRYSRPPGRFEEVEGRTTWMYLGLLTGLFTVLVVFSWACNVEPTTPTDLLPSGVDGRTQAGEVAVRLSVTVDGDIVRLSGAVPDEAARQQVFEAAAALYGQENVIDELAIDETTTMEAGVVSLAGSVVVGDDRPASLRDAITSTLGLSLGDFSVTEGEAVVEPVDLRAELDDGTVSFSGVIPDDGSVVELTAAGEAVWGAGSVDMSGLTIGDTTWTEATVVLTGATAPGDQRYEALPDEITRRFGNLVTVDVSGVTIDVSDQALTTVEAAIAEAMADQAITFARNSAEIDPASDDVLVEIAEQLQAIPGVPVEVVGHTDDQGPEDQNLALSQLRAEAVVDRLIELGLDGSRFTPRGEGEASPIADNGTAAGQATNRRIEFDLITPTN